MNDYIAKRFRKEELLGVLAGLQNPPVTGESAETGGVLFRREEFLEQLDGDEDLLRRLVALFQESSPRLVDAIAAAVRACDGKALASASHALISSLGAFGAREAIELTATLERLGERNDVASASLVLYDLRLALQKINAGLTQYLRSPD